MFKNCVYTTYYKKQNSSLKISEINMINKENDKYYSKKYFVTWNDV